MSLSRLVKKKWAILSASLVFLTIFTPFQPVVAGRQTFEMEGAHLAAIKDGFEWIQYDILGLAGHDPQVLLRNRFFQGLRQFLYLLAAVAAAAVLYGGFLYITSLGEEDKTRRGKQVLLYAAIGLILASLSVMIVNAIINIPLGSTLRGTIFLVLRSLVIPLSTIAAAAMMYGGFLYITSRGDEDQARRGKMALTYGALGLIIVMFSALIVNALINII